MDKQLMARICLIANRAKQEQYEDVAAWMQKHLADEIRESRARKPRVRGVKVKLAKARGALAVLNAGRVRELMNDDNA